MTRKQIDLPDGSGGAAFSVRVVTRSSKAEVVGVQEDGILKVRLTQAQEGGAANRELVEILANLLGVETKRIEIVAGENGRDKLISVDGITPEYLESKLNAVESVPDKD